MVLFFNYGLDSGTIWIVAPSGNGNQFISQFYGETSLGLPLVLTVEESRVLGGAGLLIVELRPAKYLFAP